MGIFQGMRTAAIGVFALLLFLAVPASALDAFSSPYIYPIDPWPVLEALGIELGLPPDNQLQEISLNWDAAKLRQAAGLAADQPLELAVAGDFNGWKPQPCKANADKGGFSTVLRVKPGTYAYKTVISGKWIADPQAARTGPDGYGGVNSILVAGRPQSNERLFPESLTGDGLTAIFRLRSRVELSAAALALNGLPHSRHSENRASVMVIRGGLVTISLPLSLLQAGPLRITLRALDSQGNPLMPFDQYLALDDLEKARVEGSTGIIYFAMTDRFRNGDRGNDNPVRAEGLDPANNFMGGDFAGLRQALEEDYFSDLAVNYLWISPVQKSAEGAWRDSLPPHLLFTGYHGYWPISLYSTEPRQGSMGELRGLGTGLRQRGIGLLLDQVFNHVHRDNPLFAAHPEWFASPKTPDGRPNIRLFNEFPITTWFDDFLPSFDYASNPEAVNLMVENGLWWLAVSGAAGFRLDAVKHVDPIFWEAVGKAFRQERRPGQGPAFSSGRRYFMVGETISDRNSIAAALRRKDVPLQFDFPLYYAIRDTFATGSMDFATLEDQLCRSEQSFCGLNLVSTLLGNHDFPRFMEYAKGDFQGLERAFAFLLTNRGYPLIYYGDEVGLAGTFQGDNRSPMVFGEELSADQQGLVASLRRLCALRQAWPVLVKGERMPLQSAAGSLAYARVWPGQSALTLFGKPGETVSLRVPRWFLGAGPDREIGAQVPEILPKGLKVSLRPVGLELIPGADQAGESLADSGLWGQEILEIQLPVGPTGWTLLCWER